MIPARHRINRRANPLNPMKLTEALELHSLLSKDGNYSNVAIFSDTSHRNAYKVEAKRADGKKITAGLIAGVLTIEVI